MTNEIEKFSLEDEKQLLSEMEMLEVYGGSAAAPANYQLVNGCKCKVCVADTGSGPSGGVSGPSGSSC